MNTNTKNPEFEAKKTKLINMSTVAREYREQMVLKFMEEGNEELAMIAMMRPLNFYIIELFYKSEINNEFHTFKGWLSNGKAVQKGEKGFMIWGEKIGATKKTETVKEDGTKEENEKNYRFWPVSYIFGNSQVKEILEEVEA